MASYNRRDNRTDREKFKGDEIYELLLKHAKDEYSAVRAAKALYRAGFNSIDEIKCRALDSLEQDWDPWWWLSRIRSLGPQAEKLIKTAMKEPLSSVTITITDHSKNT